MKKFLQRIYGMQYEELEQQGKDGNKARFNGNLFVSAYLVVILFVVIVALTHVPDYNDSMNRFFHRVFGYSSGKAVGKLLAVPLLAAVYYLVRFTVGSETAFREHVLAYKEFSEEEKKKSARIVLLPFMAMLGLMLVLALT